MDKNDEYKSNEEFLKERLQRNEIIILKTMKFSAAALLLTIALIVVSDTSAKKYHNHEIAGDVTGLLGHRAYHTYEAPEEMNGEKQGEGRRGLKGKASRRDQVEDSDSRDGGFNAPKEDSSDSGDMGTNADSSDMGSNGNSGGTATGNTTSNGGSAGMGADDDTAINTDDEVLEDSQFYQAESLDFFRKGINPELFEWINPNEIEAGATTCGFLKPDLGSQDKIYPIIRVYVCMRFATKQPAQKGNLFLHCGGPGSLSDCIFFFDADLGEQNLADYNLLSIDQRGMGRSWPSFAHEECSENEFIRAENGTIIGVVPPPEQQDENITVDFTDGDFLKSTMLPPIKRRVESCFTCTTCDFQLEATQPNGNVTKFHFLEYSGTRQLAEDIFRMRLLLNAPTMHVYGVSYGTSVFSTYATIFPDYTGLFVLDSCTSPVPDHYHNARTGAIGFNERIDYIIYSCSAQNLVEPGSCPVQDMRSCIDDMSSLLRQEDIGPGTQAQAILGFVIGTMMQNPDRAEELCTLANEEDSENFGALVDELSPVDLGAEEATSRQGLMDPSSQPTLIYPEFGIFVYDNPEYSTINADDQISIVAVRAQDRAGPIYDEERFVMETKEIGERYKGAGTGVPAGYFFSEYSIGYYWPKAVPLPPAGNSFITGIIVGILFDSNTPYTWTQEMRANFPNTNLLTSQSIFHGIGGNDPECQMHVTKYFEDGFVSFVDGSVCGSDFASAEDLLAAFTPGRR